MVTVERHDPGELAECRAARDARRTIADTLLGRPFEWDTAARLLQVEAELAALDALLAEPDRVVLAELAAGAALGAAAGLAAAHAGATVRVALDRRDYRFEAAGNAGMHGQRWCLAFSLASIAGEPEVRRWLGQDRVVRASQRGPGEADAFWEPLCRALAELSEGRSAEAPLALAVEATEPGAARIAEAEYVELTRRPLIALAALLRDGVSTTGWTLAVLAALEAHRLYYGGLRQREPMGMLAFEILGLCALARWRGITTEIQSPYLPLAWLDGAWPPMLLRLDFPERTVADALEARWVIDRHGYPRTGRSDRLDSGDNGLIVRYSAPACARLPAAEFAFVEAKPVPGGPGLLALSATEALAAARDLAEQGLLGEALAALRRVEAVTPEADRATLSAMRAAWQARRPAPDRDADAEPALAAEATANALDIGAAMVAAEIVKQAARPMLESLRGEDIAARLAALQPRPDDYPKVFVADAVEAARAAYTKFWETPPPVVAPERAHTELSLWVAPAGMLREPNLLSRQFPGGYETLSRWLNPHRVWLAWRFANPGAVGGLSYDALVWCDDHWAWFPRPYLVLRNLVARTPNGTAAR
jgi:hypothetical protein